MSREPLAWVLNLDAEHELEARGHYQPTQQLAAIVARESQRLIGELVAPRDVLVTSEQLERDPTLRERVRGLRGAAWSPTPRALALLRAAGAEPSEAPAVEVLRRVNARPFAARVRVALQGESFEKRVVSTLDEVLACVGQPASEGWLVRRTFGAAGRGRRRLHAGQPTPAEVSWIEASLRLGPLVIEPWVVVTREYTRSGWVSSTGGVVISPPCFQAVNEHGAWTRTEQAERGAVSRSDDERLQAAMQAAGDALAQSGYFGPFGIDAFRHRVPGRNETALNPLSEINARFTMDWATAMSPHVSRVEPLLASRTQ